MKNQNFLPIKINIKIQEIMMKNIRITMMIKKFKNCNQKFNNQKKIQGSQLY